MTIGIRIKSATGAQSLKPLGLMASLLPTAPFYEVSCNWSVVHDPSQLDLRCDQGIPTYRKPFDISGQEAAFPNYGTISVFPSSLDEWICPPRNPKLAELKWRMTDELRKPTHVRSRVDLKNIEGGGKYSVTGEFIGEEGIPLNRRDRQMLLTSIGLYGDNDRDDFYNHLTGKLFEESRGELLGRAVLQQYGLRSKLDYKDLVKAAELYALLASSKIVVVEATHSPKDAYFFIGFVADDRAPVELQAERNCLMRDAFYLLWNEGVNLHEEKGCGWAGCVVDEGRRHPIDRWVPRTHCKEAARDPWDMKPKREQGEQNPEGN